jgi:hypothetical protein
MDGLRVAKYGVQSLHLVIWVVITIVVVGPVAGFVTPLVAPQYEVGFGVGLSQNQISQQFQFLSSQNPVGTHTIVIPVYNRWFFQAKASLSLRLIAAGNLVYETRPASIDLPAFSTGELDVTVQITGAILSQLQGKQVTIGGDLTFGTPPQLWSLTVKFPQG